ncbi:MAG: hypothetical protein A2X46_11570 [Lentisphaerae bacterium GWF2_57_35]|nr:MAG: hypothetical protein A2X46_11570 [Lentisphaerae bacterium GWF2_57_35]
MAKRMDPTLLDLFTARTGIKVVYEEYESLDRLSFDLQAEPSRWDVVIARDYTVNLLRELRLLTPMNLSILPGLKNIDWRFLNLPFDPGNRYSVPYLWGTTVLAYRKDKAKPPESWDALWDSAYTGRIMMLDHRREALGLALLHTGSPLDSQNEEQLERAGKALVKQAGLIRGYGDSMRLAEALVTGDVDVAPLYNGDAVVAMTRNPEVGCLLPAQGSPRWMDQFVISRDARHIPEAYAFINFFCEPEVAAKNANRLKFATPNKAAEPYLDSDVKNNDLIYPGPSILAQCRFFPPFDVFTIRLLNSTWSELDALTAQRSAANEPRGIVNP